jgi:hypothetical protein
MSHTLLLQGWTRRGLSCAQRRFFACVVAANAKVGLEMVFHVGPFKEDTSPTFDVRDDAAALPVLDGAYSPAEADSKCFLGDEAFGFRDAALVVCCCFRGRRCGGFLTPRSAFVVVVFCVHISLFSLLFRIAAACPFRHWCRGVGHACARVIHPVFRRTDWFNAEFRVLVVVFG